MTKPRPWFSDYNIREQWSIGRVDVRFSSRSSNGFMGRFGGGWNWKLGVQIGGNTMLIGLLIAELCVSIRKAHA